MGNARNCRNKILLAVLRYMPHVVCTRLTDVGKLTVADFFVIRVINLAADKLNDEELILGKLCIAAFHKENFTAQFLGSLNRFNSVKSEQNNVAVRPCRLNLHRTAFIAVKI